jgi:putative addiction module component (TIGR02574 family)
MTSEALDALLKLPPGDRAELAIALWESLDDKQRESQFSISPEEAAELDRRVKEHLADPASAIPWEAVRSKLRGGE